MLDRLDAEKNDPRLGCLGVTKNEPRLLMTDPVSGDDERLESFLDCSLLTSVVESPSDSFIVPT